MDQHETPCEPLDSDQPPFLDSLPGGVTPNECAPCEATANECAPMASGFLAGLPAGTETGSCGGAPLANLNHAGSMLHSDPALGQLRLALGKLPADLVRVERSANQFRKMLEKAVVEACGEIDLTAALAINTAAKWHRHSDLALRWLRDHGDRMDDAERLKYSREVARASAERDKAVERLRLSTDQRNEMDVAARIVELHLSSQGGALPSAITHHQG